MFAVIEMSLYKTYIISNVLLSISIQTIDRNTFITWVQYIRQTK